MNEIETQASPGEPTPEPTPEPTAELTTGPTVEPTLGRRELLAGAFGVAAASVLPGNLVFGAPEARLPARIQAGLRDSIHSGLHGDARSGLPASTQAAFPRKNDFTNPNGVVYLNGAYMHPMPNVVRQAVREYNDARAHFTTQTSSEPDIAGRVKADFAALINAEPEEICFVPNTSSGEVLVVHGLDIPRSGGNVVTDALHFEGSIVHLQSLQRDQGLDLRIVMPREGRIDLEDLESVVDRNTRLVELSLVTMYNGFQHDLKAVCDLAHSVGAYVYADIIQAAGAVPIDVRESNVDFCACSGFKWLMGDLGLGFLYVRKDLIGSVLQRTQYGYHSVRSFETHFLPFDPPGPAPFTWELGDDATTHYEVGSAAGSARAALGASLPYLRRLGVENIERHRQPLLERLRAEMPRLGFECVTPPGTTSPIITFALENGDRVRERLQRANIDVRVARTFIRFSPSVYNDLADVDSVLEALS